VKIFDSLDLFGLFFFFFFFFFCKRRDRPGSFSLLSFEALTNVGHPARRVAATTPPPREGRIRMYGSDLRTRMAPVAPLALPSPARAGLDCGAPQHPEGLMTKHPIQHPPISHLEVQPPFPTRSGRPRVAGRGALDRRRHLILPTRDLAAKLRSFPSISSPRHASLSGGLALLSAPSSQS
jgi:hypothetical protein